MTSINEVEQGLPTLEDATQWSLNHLSSSQIAMANPNITVRSISQQQFNQKKTSLTKRHVPMNQIMGFMVIFVRLVLGWDVSFTTLS